jgi:hypothetical protein
MAADWSLVTESCGGVGRGDLVLKALLDPIPLAEESELARRPWRRVPYPPMRGTCSMAGSPRVGAELAGLGVSVAGYDLLLMASLEPRGVVV